MTKAVTFADLINAFLDGEREGVSSTGTLKIVDNQLIHYKTPIVERYNDNYIVNVSRYSLATGQLQKKVKLLIPKEKQIMAKRVPFDYIGSLAAYTE